MWHVPKEVTPLNLYQPVQTLSHICLRHDYIFYSLLPHHSFEAWTRTSDYILDQDERMPNVEHLILRQCAIQGASQRPQKNTWITQVDTFKFCRFFVKHLHFILHILRRVWCFDPQTQSPAILLWPDPRALGEGSCETTYFAAIYIQSEPHEWPIGRRNCGAQRKWKSWKGISSFPRFPNVPFLFLLGDRSRGPVPEKTGEELGGRRSFPQMNIGMVVRFFLPTRLRKPAIRLPTVVQRFVPFYGSFDRSICPCLPPFLFPSYLPFFFVSLWRKEKNRGTDIWLEIGWWCFLSMLI